MALSYGLRPTEKHDSIWKLDESLEGVDAAALKAWKESGGESRFLEPFIKNGKPSRITWRTLDGDEVRYMRGIHFEIASFSGALEQAYRRGFRMGVTFDDMPQEIRDENGDRHPTKQREGVHMMLTSKFCDFLDFKYPGMIDFYGKLIYDASQLTEKEKKALSPPSTQTPSEAAASTTGTTEHPPEGQGA